jgi:hypothetical protein
MITLVDCGNLILAQYGRGPDPGWDLLQDSNRGGVAVAVKVIQSAGVRYVVRCWEGSHDEQDWWHDVDAEHVAITDMGSMHKGFMIGMLETWRMLAEKFPGPSVDCGHSLGAAHATIAAGIGVIYGKAPLFYARWGEPAVCRGPEVGNLLTGVPGVSLRNIQHGGFETERDYVCSVPLSLFGWRHPQVFTDVWAPPNAEAEKWGPFMYHHFGSADGGGYLSVTPATVIVP